MRETRSAPTPRWRGLAPLQHRNYVSYLVGFAVSNTGRWVQVTGWVWLVYEMTSSATMLGLVGVVRAVPALIVSPVAGVVADRVDQRKMLIAAQSLALFSAAGVGALIASGHAQLWHIYAQIGLHALLTTCDGAARHAYFPNLVPRSRLAEAITLNTSAARCSELVGPVIGGVAIARLGEAAPFFLDAASFAFMIVMLVQIRSRVEQSPATPDPEHVAGSPDDAERTVDGTHAARSTFRGHLLEGLAHIARAPVLRGLLQLEFVFGLLQVNPVIITILARELIGGSPTTLGVMLSAPALGGLFGVLHLIVAGHVDRKGRFVILCQAGYVLALLVLAASRTYPLSLLALSVTGYLDVLATVTRHSIMQLAVPSRMRGRVMSNMAVVTRGTGPLSEMQSGILSAAIGPSWALTCAATVLATAVGLTARSNRSLMRFRMDPASRDVDGTLSIEEA